MDQRTYWNSVAEKKVFTTPLRMTLLKQYVARGSRILDMGCGYGRALQELSASGFRKLIGIDTSRGMIEKGRRLYPDLCLKLCDNGRLPFSDESFDAVLILAVLTCVVEDAAIARLLDEVERVLNPGGIVYINDFLLNTDERNRNRYRQCESTCGTYGVFRLDEGAVLRHFSIENIRQLMARFTCLVLEQTVYKTMNDHESNGFYYIGRKK